MGPWSCKEISAARTHIFKDQHVADVKGRFSKWGGIPRFVLPNTDEESQALLKEAIDTFNIGNLTHIMIMPDMKSSEQAFDIGHKIVHLTVDANNLHGPVVFASDWVREELVRRFSHLKQREERKFLEDGWGNQVPEVFAFGKALRERYAKVIRPSTL
ncbi:g7391 [Coccomyxa viridis]|uniref:G7391 protein n=1 Tax=Coccomyxa viridis TaxID=1274662 RepID=A0ABP1G062_9CHLO